MRLLVRPQEERPAARELGRVFKILAGQMEPPPEEPCRKCVRLYGLFTGELAEANKDIADHYADAEYASAGVEGAAETIKLLAEYGCIPEGLVRDTDEAMKRIQGEDYDKDDVEAVAEAIGDFPILDAVAAFCRGTTA
jgi:hypothetical protein